MLVIINSFYNRDTRCKWPENKNSFSTLHPSRVCSADSFSILICVSVFIVGCH